MHPGDRYDTGSTGVAPGDVHFAGGEIYYHCIDRLLAVEWVGGVNRVVANRVREINVVPLDGLQGL